MTAINTPTILEAIKQQIDSLETNRIINKNAEQNENIYFNSSFLPQYNAALHSELSQIMPIIELLQGKTILYNLHIENSQKIEYLSLVSL